MFFAYPANDRSGMGALPICYSCLARMLEFFEIFLTPFFLDVTMMRQLRDLSSVSVSLLVSLMFAESW